MYRDSAILTQLLPPSSHLLLHSSHLMDVSSLVVFLRTNNFFPSPFPSLFPSTGFNRSIPGYPRYSMVGDPRDGVHNLRIIDVRLEDDGEYQCQVGPGANSKGIRANSRLNVLRE